eukprot:TCONS_00045583-protein
MAKLLNTLTIHTKDVNCCAFSANSKTLASVSGDKTVRLWNADSATELSYSPLNHHTYSVTCCAFSPFGSMLATGSQDYTLAIWNAEDGELIKTMLGHKGAIRCCTFSSNSMLLATASSDETIGIWNLKNYSLSRVLKGPDSSLMTCRFTPDDLYLVSGSGYGDARIWDISTGQCEGMVEGHDSGTSGCGITGCDFSLKFGSADTAQSLSKVGESPRFLLATCGGDNLIKLWHVYTASAYSMKCNFEFVVSLKGHGGHVYDCKFSQDGKMLASCSSDKTVILWDPVKYEIIAKLTGHTRYITTVCFSPDGKYLASGSNDKSVQIWQIDDIRRTESTGRQNPTHAIGNSPADQPKRKLIRNWSIDDVCDWLKELSLDQYCEVFRYNAIDGIELAQLTDHTLLNALQIGPLGHRNKITRELNELKRIESEGNIPDEFLCPITRELMADPVLVADGFTYERSSIASWFDSGNITSPMTNKPLPSNQLVPNRSLKNAIMRYFGPVPLIP